MKKMSKMIEELRKAKAIMNSNYNEEQWADKNYVNVCRANNYICAYADFVAHRDMEEIDYDVDVDELELEEIERDLSFWWEEVMERDFYEDLLYYENKVNVVID